MAKAINLDNLQKFRQKYDERLENGSLVPSKALTAKELETISQESGDTQETPFILQGTGTANGTSSVDTGTVGKHIQKQGSVYCVNQLVPDTSIFSTSGSLTVSYNQTTKQYTFSTTSTGWEIPSLAVINSINGHKYLVKPNIISKTSNANIRLRYPIVVDPLASSIISPTSNLNLFAPQLQSSDGNTATVVFSINYIDLTQWFNGNIPTSLTADNFSLYHNYGDYIPYNAGELVSGSGRYLVCGGRNLFDGEIEGGSFNTSTGEKQTSNNSFRSKNYIEVISGKQYIIYFNSALGSPEVYLFEYDKNKNFIKYGYVSGNTILSSNTKYVSFYMYKSSSGWGTNPPSQDTAQIVLSLYYAGEDYSQYYPYVAPKVYDTGTETLLSTGVKLSVSGEREDIYDYKEPDGTITRRVGSYTFTGNESWSYGTIGTTPRFQTNALKDVIKEETVNVFLSGYLIMTNQDLYSSSGLDFVGSVYVSNNQIVLRLVNRAYTDATAFTSYMAGKTIYFELATPTTEQGTPFSENIEIDDFGTMGWYSAYTDSNTNTFVNVPQGCQIFYPAWYVGFIDTLGQRADIDWNANNVVSQTQLGASETARDTVDSQLKNAIGGTLRQCLCVKASLDFNNTAWVDLGTLTWGYISASGVFYATVSGKKASNNNILSSMYQTTSNGINEMNNMEIRQYYYGTAQDVIVKNTTYTDATTFKNAMKGVLLAYEKA